LAVGLLSFLLRLSGLLSLFLAASPLLASLACSYGSYDLLRTACHEYGSRPHIIFIATTAESAITFAGSGLGIAIVPALPEDIVPPKMQRLPLDEPKLCFEQMLYWSRERRLTPAAELFLEFFKNKT